MKIRVRTGLIDLDFECDKIDVDGDTNLYLYKKTKLIGTWPRQSWYGAYEIDENSEPPRKGIVFNKDKQ